MAALSIPDGSSGAYRRSRLPNFLEEPSLHLSPEDIMLFTSAIRDSDFSSFQPPGRRIVLWGKKLLESRVYFNDYESYR